MACQSPGEEHIVLARFSGGHTDEDVGWSRLCLWNEQKMMLANLQDMLLEVAPLIRPDTKDDQIVLLAFDFLGECRLRRSAGCACFQHRQATADLLACSLQMCLHCTEV